MVTVEIGVDGEMKARVTYADLFEALDEISACGWEVSDSELIRTVYVVRSCDGIGPVVARGDYGWARKGMLQSKRPLLRWAILACTEQIRSYETEYSHLWKETG